mmetsp:Transcript_10832/g.32187  ORF Transcript_10832/g.32187 Transcript_10832/m.32187 type:complete len:321 (-) Transcript_10832:92-1054(-)
MGFKDCCCRPSRTPTTRALACCRLQASSRHSARFHSMCLACPHSSWSHSSAARPRRQTASCSTYRLYRSPQPWCTRCTTSTESSCVSRPSRRWPTPAACAQCSPWTSTRCAPSSPTCLPTLTLVAPACCPRTTCVACSPHWPPAAAAARQRALATTTCAPCLRRSMLTTGVASTGRSSWASSATRSSTWNERSTSTASAASTRRSETARAPRTGWAVVGGWVCARSCRATSSATRPSVCGGRAAPPAAGCGAGRGSDARARVSICDGMPTTSQQLPPGASARRNMLLRAPRGALARQSRLLPHYRAACRVHVAKKMHPVL